MTFAGDGENNFDRASDDIGERFADRVSIATLQRGRAKRVGCGDCCDPIGEIDERCRFDPVVESRSGDLSFEIAENGLPKLVGLQLHGFQTFG